MERVVLASCLKRFFVLFNLLFVDKVFPAGEVEVVELLEHDDADESDKVRWIDSRVALLDHKCRKEQTEGHHVHHDAEDFVEIAVAVFSFVCFWRGDSVHHDSEGLEKRVLREEQDDE